MYIHLLYDTSHNIYVYIHTYIYIDMYILRIVSEPHNARNLVTNDPPPTN